MLKQEDQAFLNIMCNYTHTLIHTQTQTDTQKHMDALNIDLKSACPPHVQFDP